MSRTRRRRLPPDTDIVAFLRALPPDRRAEAVATFGREERDAFDLSWPDWAHDGQRAPAACPDGSDWRTWVIMAGRGFGKTLAGAHWIRACVAAEPRLRAALVAATLDEARRVMVEGDTGLLEVAGDLVADWSPSRRLVEFRNGARATLFSGASPGQLRGPQHHVAWCDELAKWDKPQETWDMLQLGLRLGDHPRALVTTTPRPGPVLTGIMADPRCVTTGGPTTANPHLPKAFVDAVTALYAGTRLGRQELGGELLTDTPGALWTVELLASCRAQGSDWGPIARQRVEPASVGQPATRSGDRTDVTDSLRDGLTRPTFTRPAFTRVVIGVDPPAGDGTCGIVACARDESGIAHVLADHSVTARTPEGWATAVAHAAAIHALNPPRNGRSGPQGSGDPSGLVECPRREGDYAQHGGGAGGESPIPVLIVAETNQGGRMVKTILHTADPTLAVKPVTATLAKADRAAPVAHLFEAGKVVLHGRFPELEAQLLGLIAGRPYQGPGQSPDRADAMVWALTELMLGAKGAPSVRAL